MLNVHVQSKVELNKEDIEHIKENLSDVAANDDELVCFIMIFYQKFRAMSPSADILFQHLDEKGMEEQSKKVVATLNAVMQYLENITHPDLTKALFELGQRHVGYGAHIEDFDTGIDAMISAFREVLQYTFSEDHEDSWRKVLSTICRGVIAGMT